MKDKSLGIHTLIHSNIYEVLASLLAQLVKNGDLGSIPGWGRSPGEGNSNLLQCSCLENSMDRGRLQSWSHRQLDMTEGLTLSLSHICLYLRLHKFIHTNISYTKYKIIPKWCCLFCRVSGMVDGTNFFVFFFLMPLINFLVYI